MVTGRSILPAIVLIACIPSAAVVGSASASPAYHPVVSAVLHGTIMQVQGRHFSPGAQVAFALVDVQTWKPVYIGRSVAEAATYGCTSGTHSLCCRRVASVMCGHPDTNAGALYIRMVLDRRPSHTPLIFVYRAGNAVGDAVVRMP